MHTYNNLPIEKILQPIDYYIQNSSLYKDEFYESIRNKINSSFNDLQFDDTLHKYTLNGKELIAVSKICHLFEEKQDFLEIAKKYAKKRNLGDGIEVKRQWDLKSLKSVVSGKFNHAYGEAFLKMLLGNKNFILDEIKQFIVDGYLCPVSPKQEAIVKYFYDVLNEGEVPLLAEVKMYNDEYMYSGTFDSLHYQTESESLVIRDYKTNEELIKLYQKPLFPPFEDFNNENLSFYTIQSSLYQLCLENIGLKIKKREIVWLKDDATYELIPLKDVTDRLKKILPKLAKYNYNMN